jgi:small subunit ribosomal protein S2
MAVISMKALLETGVHFGHRTRKWNPAMKPYIFTERNSIHIIDLQQTLEALEEAFALVRDSVAEGGKVLFVGTKRQAQETIQSEAERCSMPYVNARWLGGTLTNWRTIRSRIDELEELERRRDAGEFELLTKKEALTLNRRIERLEERLAGIRGLKRVPDLLFVVDVRREETAIHEANLLGIPVIALVDTNCDPRGVDYVIPSNDDAIRAIKLLTSTIANAAQEGLEMRKDRAEEMEEGEAATRAPAPAAEMTDEELLGEATLAKLKSGEYDERDLQLEALLAAGGQDVLAAAEAEGAKAPAPEAEGAAETAAEPEAEVEAGAETAEPDLEKAAPEAEVEAGAETEVEAGAETGEPEAESADDTEGKDEA